MREREKGAGEKRNAGGAYQIETKTMRESEIEQRSEDAFVNGRGFCVTLQDIYSNFCS